MWWHILIGTVIGMVIGGGVWSWGWNIGYKYGREEDAYKRYAEAMKNDE